MKLSTRGRYGVKAMFELAKSFGEAPVSIKEISERQNISEYYLEQLFSSLRKAGLVKSVRGAQGGYVLSREPKDITIGDIFNVLEGPIELSECITEEMNCSRIDYCATRLLWLKINNSINEVLNSTTLQDVLNDYINLQNHRMKGE